MQPLQPRWLPIRRKNATPCSTLGLLAVDTKRIIRRVLYWLLCSLSSSGSRSHFSERQSHTSCWLDLANSFINIKTKFYFKLLTLLFWYLLLIPQGASDEKFFNMEYYISNINYVHILYVLYMYKCIKCIKSIIYVLLFGEAALSCCPCLSAPPYALSLFMHSLHIQILIWHFCPIYFHLFAHVFLAIYFNLFAHRDISFCRTIILQGRLLKSTHVMSCFGNIPNAPKDQP